MGFMNECAEDAGWNNCINYILKHLEEFKSKLEGDQYDYFPESEIKQALQKLIRK